MREIYIEKTKSSFNKGPYDVYYTPWRVISFWNKEEADVFAKKLKEKLNQKKFNDWDIGYVLRITDKIINEK